MEKAVGRLRNDFVHEDLGYGKDAPHIPSAVDLVLAVRTGYVQDARTHA